MGDRYYEPDIQQSTSPCCDCTEGWADEFYFYRDKSGRRRRGANSCLDSCVLLEEWWDEIGHCIPGVEWWDEDDIDHDDEVRDG